MARKKSFSGGINSLLESTVNESGTEQNTAQGKGKQQKKIGSDSTIASFVIRTDTLEVMRALAYWERKKIKDVLEEAMQQLQTQKGDSMIGKALDEYRKHIAEE